MMKKSSKKTEKKQKKNSSEEVATHCYLPLCRDENSSPPPSPSLSLPLPQSLSEHSLWAHDFVRALRMGSYGFLLYGPASHFWYQFLDRSLPAKSFQNLLIKVSRQQRAHKGGVGMGREMEKDPSWC